VSAPAGPRGPIRAVVFDVGGILEPPFDDVLVPELAAMLGIPEPQLLQRRAADAVALMVGRMTLREFYAGVVAEAGRPVEPGALVERHLAIYGAATTPLDARVLGLIQTLRRRHVVACLTNTEVEVARFNRERGLFAPFDRAFLPTEMGLHKPDRAIYQRALAELGCEAPEAVFTDDKLENVAAARAVGMSAIHYRGFERFVEDLARVVGRED
jgi:putative hydrolase of the HAD superfamily